VRDKTHDRHAEALLPLQQHVGGRHAAHIQRRAARRTRVSVKCRAGAARVWHAQRR